jgi:hypothetical protein
MSSWRPYYRAAPPSGAGRARLFRRSTRSGSYQAPTTPDAFRGLRQRCGSRKLLQARGAAVVRASVRPDGDGNLEIYPSSANNPKALLEAKHYVLGAGFDGHLDIDFFVPTSACLAVWPTPSTCLEVPTVGYRTAPRGLFSGLGPGWCGTLGPFLGSDTAKAIFNDQTEGNYDMTQMRLLPMAYRYFEQSQRHRWITPPPGDEAAAERRDGVPGTHRLCSGWSRRGRAVRVRPAGPARPTYPASSSSLTGTPEPPPTQL